MDGGVCGQVVDLTGQEICMTRVSLRTAAGPVRCVFSLIDPHGAVSGARGGDLSLPGKALVPHG